MIFALKIVRLSRSTRKRFTNFLPSLTFNKLDCFKKLIKMQKKYPQHVDYAFNETFLVKMLSMKHGDVALTDPKVALYTAKKEGIDNITVLKKNIEKKELVLSFRNDKDNKRRIDLLTQILKKAKNASE